jgi:hypothetical protein
MIEDNFLTMTSLRNPVRAQKFRAICKRKLQLDDGRKASA